ncbi:MAG: RNA polymerase factor sigma-54 [Chloroflexi bacterium]|nr:RNA polymerase factor sigma-54 [Chloroflexota bacterium]
MELELDLSQDYSASQTMKVSPRLVAANYILELSSQELQQQISRELDDNPALELIDVPTCNICGSELHGSICPRCIQRQKGTDSPYSQDPASRFDDVGERSERSPDDDEFDPLTRVASEQTLGERLLMDMGSVIGVQDFPIAEYLVGSLDEKGYLAIKPEDVAYDLEVSEDRVRAVIRVLQAQEPIGIGARNLRECLLIQIDHLEERGLTQPHAREVVSQFLTELGEHKFSRIAHELKIPVAQVEDIWEFVKTKLNPHPAHGFSSTNTSDRDTRAMYITPDVVITQGVEDFEVEVVESRRFVLRVNPMYTRLSTELHRANGSMTADEKKHVQQYVGRAKLFIANINQRRQTLANITRCLVDQQREFLQKGVRHLRPLSRAAVAQELGVHESTVSRATAQKYVMLPSGEVIPYAHFFTPSLSVKDIMKEVIEKEGRPLTDSQIVERLKERGIFIARRTVAKYRMQLAILPSSLR